MVRAPIVDEVVVRELVKDVQRALLQADVNVQQVFDLSKRIEKKSREEVPPGVSKRESLIKTVYEELTKLVGDKCAELPLEKGERKVLMLVGIQGSGKTTAAAKLANFVKKKGFKPVLVCADTYRKGALQQLEQLVGEVNIPVFGRGKDPIDIVRRSMGALEEGSDVIIVDTAGRHKDEVSLIKEMRLMNEAIKPDEVILVVDATIGQQAFSQAKAFHEATPVGSIFLTKLDSSAKGGGALAAVAATGAPIRFIGVGERLDDVELFDPSKFIGRLLGMGDLEGLIQRVKEAEEAEATIKVRKPLTDKLTIDDVYNQLKMLGRMGPMKSLLKMLPGVGYGIPDEVLDVAESKTKKWGHIIQSMNRREKEDPRLIKGRRLREIAYGSGTSEKDVKELVNFYFMMRKLMKKVLRSRDARFMRLLREIGGSFNL